MTSVNSLQHMLHNQYNLLGNTVPTTKAEPNTHNLGLNANLLQNLRVDLGSVANGSNPERALNNLMAGLQQFLGSTHAMAQEWPAGKALPEGGVDLVKGEGGQPKVVTPAQEWPAGKALPEGGVDLVKGEGGQPKMVTPAQEWPAGKALPDGGVDLVKGEDGQPKVVTPAQEWPAGKALPDGGVDLVKGEDGQPKVVTPAQEWPAGKALPEGGVDLVKGKDGQPVEFEASEAQRNAWENSNSAVQTDANAAISNLKQLLDTQAAGGDISQASAHLRSALQSLFENTSLADGLKQVRDALRESIRSQV
ncbi:hypothetical protein SAMN04490190_4521 [Pseudomonas libanensis]|uniref:hypothetical protein n=1 Tax=Pseudomonas libanensis TaxID=75588 RepID=UPI00087B1732|nr:hypothetical protein [Pseudomonas libanensis]SDL32636.1 hypothetical protein SAMN04490190_4521 [Pseudomonas libanensis]